jgi:ParB family chromosome partitioning protein
MSIKRNALGKGLSALLENAETDVTSKGDIGNDGNVLGSIATIHLDQIETNPFQPRTDFDEESLKELAVSIKEQGIIQPITVRKMGYDKYQIISGERRVRASKLAGLESIPAYIRVANDQSMLEMALVENIQRSDLNPIETAFSAMKSWLRRYRDFANYFDPKYLISVALAQTTPEIARKYFKESVYL